MKEVTLAPAATGLQEKLSQNLPNPFHGATSISYTLVDDCKISIAVYDGLGQNIGVIASGAQSAGTHAVMFDGSRLTPGMYYYRMSVNGVMTASRQMSVTR